MSRGDIVLARFPHASNTDPKERPVLIVQSDYYNQRIKNVLVAGSNLARQNDPAHLLVDIATADGAGAGLSRTSLVSCLNLAVMSVQQMGIRLGRLSPQQMERVDQCLQIALGLEVRR